MKNTSLTNVNYFNRENTKITIWTETFRHKQNKCSYSVLTRRENALKWKAKLKIFGWNTHNKTNIVGAAAKKNETRRKCPICFPCMCEIHMFCMLDGHSIDFNIFAILIFNTNHEFEHFYVCCGYFIFINLFYAYHFDCFDDITL